MNLSKVGLILSWLTLFVVYLLVNNPTWRALGRYCSWSSYYERDHMIDLNVRYKLKCIQIYVPAECMIYLVNRSDTCLLWMICNIKCLIHIILHLFIFYLSFNNKTVWNYLIRLCLPEQVNCKNKIHYLDRKIMTLVRVHVRRHFLQPI